MVRAHVSRSTRASSAQGGDDAGLATLLPALLEAMLQPFDALRHSYAGAVSAGLVPRSMLVNREVERWLMTLEALALGPWARRR